MKKTDRTYVELDLASIVGATENLRETAPRLSEQGYGVFQATEHQSETLQSLALSGDAQHQGQLVSLIDKYEPEIKELANNMTTTGQLEPIRVRQAEEKGKYTVAVGKPMFIDTQSLCLQLPSELVHPILGKRVGGHTLSDA